MNKKIFLSILFFCQLLNAQVIIGTSTIDSESVIMDFDNDLNNTKGIILPAVDKLPEFKNDSNNGTFLYDKSSQNVMVLENNSWKNLSEYGNSKDIIFDNSQDIGDGVIIGSESSDASGILILEAIDKALKLPKINDPDMNVKGPYPGMICYDVKSKSLAVFDGEYWSYWK